MPRKKKTEVDSKIQEKLDYIGLDLDKIPKVLKEYTNINFRTLKGYDEKKYVNQIISTSNPHQKRDLLKDLFVKIKYNEDSNSQYYSII